MQIASFHPALPFGNSPTTQRISAASTGASSGTGNGSSSTGSGGISSTFLQLLTTELQTQDPLSAQDPTTYITQLVGLNTLDQLTQINSLLRTQFTQQSGSGSTGGAQSQANASLANFLKGATS